MNGAIGRAMRILEIETFGRGGLIHYSYNLSRALAERGHEVTLLTTAAFELEEQSLPANLRVIKAMARWTHRKSKRIPARLLDRARSVEAAFDTFAVAALARRQRPDVIHLHSTHVSSLTYLALLRTLGIPIAATAHVVTPHEPMRLQSAIYRRIHQLSHLVVAHSAFDRQRLIDEFAVDPLGVVVIPHGDYEFFDRGIETSDGVLARQSLGLEPRDKVALFFGHIREYKGLDVLLEAWPAVVEALPDARLVVAGDPGRLSDSRRQELEGWTTRVGAVHRFEYIPFSDVARYFGAADLLVLPYRHISQSGVLYLSMSLGVPVVATAVGALPEVLRDGESALLVPPESPAELSRALIRLLSDKQLRERLAEGGCRVVAEHSWPSIAARTEEAFAKLSRDYLENN